METIHAKKGLVVRFLEDFVCAGTSALLISTAHLHPHSWPVSLFALIPFLWRAARVSLLEAAVTATVLGTSYCFLTIGFSSVPASDRILIELLIPNALFVSYGIAVNRIAKHVGFNAMFIAVVWLPLEYGLSHHAHLKGVFDFCGTDSSILPRIVSLFGTLMVAFLAVLVNSLILIVSERIVRALCSASKPRAADNGERSALCENMILQWPRHGVAAPRAPPPHPVMS